MKKSSLKGDGRPSKSIFSDATVATICAIEVKGGGGSRSGGGGEKGGGGGGILGSDNSLSSREISGLSSTGTDG